jgi:hypothetical protein
VPVDVPAETPPSWTLDCEPNVIILGSTTYYQCGTAWYIRVYRGGDIAYTMVNRRRATELSSKLRR